MLATAGLTLSDVKPVMVPNVLRGGDDFMAGANDMFMFSFGGPKVREADATVGGVRAVKVGDTPGGLEASRRYSLRLFHRTSSRSRPMSASPSR